MKEWEKWFDSDISRCIVGQVQHLLLDTFICDEDFLAISEHSRCTNCVYALRREANDKSSKNEIICS